MPAKPRAPRNSKRAVRTQAVGPSPRASIKTIHHPPENHALVGNEERLAVLRRRALQLRIQGKQYRVIADEIALEFELEGTPAINTVHDWVEAALREGLREQKQEAKNYVRLVMERSEQIIQSLYPYAAGLYVVERTRVIDGVPMKIIDAEVLDERIKAAGEIRKQHDSVLKAMGVTGPERKDDGANQLGAGGMQMFVIQTVTNHIAAPGEKAAQGRESTVLELRSGDDDIDKL